MKKLFLLLTCLSLTVACQKEEYAATDLDMEVAEIQSEQIEENPLYAAGESITFSDQTTAPYGAIYRMLRRPEGFVGMNNATWWFYPGYNGFIGKTGRGVYRLFPAGATHVRHKLNLDAVGTFDWLQRALLKKAFLTKSSHKQVPSIRKRWFTFNGLEGFHILENIGGDNRFYIFLYDDNPSTLSDAVFSYSSPLELVSKLVSLNGGDGVNDAFERMFRSVHNWNDPNQIKDVFFRELSERNILPPNLRAPSRGIEIHGVTDNPITRGELFANADGTPYENPDGSVWTFRAIGSAINACSIDHRVWIQREWWERNQLNYVAKASLVFHELGHAQLHRDHSCDWLEDIMFSIECLATADGPILGRNYSRFKPIFMDNLDRLFTGEGQTTLPCSSGKNSGPSIIH